MAGKASANKYWRRTFLHEIAHILNRFWRVDELNQIGRARDEELAEEWIAFLGIQYGTETSAEDLKLKQGIQ